MAIVEQRGHNLSGSQRRFLDLAVKQAMSSNYRWQHGCLIVRNGNVLAFGQSKFRNFPGNVDPRHIKSGCSIHAEADAISRAGNCRGAAIYIARVNRRGETRFSKPCDNCYKIIDKAGIRTVIYTEDA